MILELDCGNSFIKWRVLDASASELVSEGVVDSNQALLESRQIIKPLSLRKCRLVSVRTNEETSALTEMLEREFGIPIRYAGIGERSEDLRVFDAEAFVDALLPDALGT